MLKRMNWTEFFNGLSDSEKDKIAVLRVIECTNGVLQHAFRDGAPWALSVEETREAMQFSMGCMKRMEIPLSSGSVTFEPETEQTLRKVRELYIAGVKNGVEESFKEFMEASEASVKAVGSHRLMDAGRTVRREIKGPISQYVDYGVNYLSQFL